MNHEAMEILVEKRLAGVLSSTEDGQLTEHLASCEGCRCFEARAQGTNRQLSGAPGATMSVATVEARVARARVRDALTLVFIMVCFGSTAGAAYAYDSTRHLTAFFLTMILFGLLVGGYWLRAHRREALAAQARGDYFAAYRKRLERRIRFAPANLALLASVAQLPSILSPEGGFEGAPALRALLVAAIGLGVLGALAQATVMRRRWQRELSSLGSST